MDDSEGARNPRDSNADITEGYSAIMARINKEAEDNTYAAQSDRSSMCSVNSGTSVDHSRADTTITNTSPEPEETLEKDSRSSEDIYAELGFDVKRVYEAKLFKLKWFRNLFISLTTALGVALIATLAGLIFLAVTRNDKKPAKSSGANFVPLIPTVHDTVKTLHFDSVDASDIGISSVFADHTLYQSFYGVTYDGPKESTNCSLPYYQRSVAIDVALLSRVTERIRIETDRCSLVERVLKAISDIKVNAAVVLSVKASEWRERNEETRRILASYPAALFDSVLLEQDDSPDVWWTAYTELQAFFKRQSIENVGLYLVEPKAQQPNPLELSNDPNITRNWVISDKARRVYTNLESPSETSEKARAMTAWVCGVSSYLDANLAWFWSTGFDSASGAKNGIFFSDRTLKPAGLPRCDKYV